MDDLAGRILRGYELRGRLGAGGFGAVYRAFQPAVGREVAIKVILPQYANQPEFIRRFETEAQLVARLEHPFIVPLFDYWREPDGAYLVMRLFRGGSLRAALDHRHFAGDDAVRLVDQIAGALAVAHRNGVVHRDLKPDNILLDDENNAYLSDFGIAKVGTQTSVEEDPDSITGSPGYMSPEQITGQPVTPQTDIYSLGVMLYEIVTGSHPFLGASMSELIIRNLQEPLPDVNAVRPELPGAVNAVIQRATAKQPAQRYTDAAALAADFKRAFQAETAPTFIEIEDLFIPVNPYKGLRPFEEADAADFFGREALIERLLARMAETDDMADFLAVIGPSGSGKSSVVKAGLIPALRQGRLPGSDRWFIVEMVPGSDPFEKLEAALLSVAVNPAADLRDQLRQSERGLVAAVEQVLPPDAALLLVIDQFEEVFTLLPSEADRSRFLTLLASAVQGPENRLRIAVTLRADFYDRPLLYEGFGALIRARTEVVLPLSSEELERAITGPADRAGLFIEPNLLAAIVADVREEPGALPLLQYVLTEVFERREGRLLTLAGYQDSGGVSGALARRASEIYAAMPPAQQTITRQLFLRLVTLGEGTEDTRRRVQWAEVSALADDRSALQAVLDTFGKYRLLSFDRDSQTREPTIEVAHEALIREWEQLREWLNASRESVRLQRSLAVAAGEWENARRDASFVLRGTRLGQIEEWAQTTDLALTPHERAFLQASIAQRAAQQAEEAAQRARELALERQARLRLRALAVVLSVAFIIALALTGLALNQNQIAQLERDNAEAARSTSEANAATATVAQGRAIIEADNAQTQAAIAEREADISRSLALAASARQIATSAPTLALALALEANRIAAPPDQAQRVLADIAYAPGMIRPLGGDEPGHTAAVADVVFSPDGRFLLTSSDDSRLILWDAATGQPVRTFTGHTLPVESAAFSPDSALILSGSWDTTLILWDVETGGVLRRFTGHNGVVNTVVFIPNGQTALSGSSDGIIQWDIATGEIVQRLGETTHNVLSLAITADGTRALSGAANRQLTLWDLTTGAILQRYQGHTSDVLGVALSPDGTTALSSSRDNTIILWDLDSGRELRRLGDASGEGHSLPANSVAFSPDERKAISGGDDNRVIIWDVASGGILQRFDGHTGPVNSVAFSPDGRAIASGGDDQIAILWSVENDAVLRWFAGNPGGANGVAFSPDGQIAASGGDDQTIRLWDAATGYLIRTLEGHSGAVHGLAFSPDGRTLLSASEDATLILWDVATGEPIRTFGGHSDAVNRVAFSGDGQAALSASDDETLILWDVTSGAAIRTLAGHTSRVLSVALSAEGTLALSGSADRTLRLWDVITGESLHVFEGHNRRVLSVALSQDARIGLSASDDNSLILWDLTTFAPIRRFSPRGEETAGAISSGAYSPEGQMLISGSEDGVITLWDPANGQIIRSFTVPLGISSRVESITFSPDGNSALASLRDGRLVLWRTPSLAGLIAWITANRYVPELTCDQREQFGVRPLCAADGSLPGATPASTAAPSG